MSVLDKVSELTIVSNIINEANAEIDKAFEEQKELIESKWLEHVDTEIKAEEEFEEKIDENKNYFSLMA